MQYICHLGDRFQLESTERTERTNGAVASSSSAIKLTVIAFNVTCDGWIKVNCLEWRFDRGETTKKMRRDQFVLYMYSIAIGKTVADWLLVVTSARDNVLYTVALPEIRPFHILSSHYRQRHQVQPVWSTFWLCFM